MTIKCRAHVQGPVMRMGLAFFLVLMLVSPSPFRGQNTEPEPDEAFQSLMHRVEKVRALSFKRPVKRKTLDEQTLKQLLEKAFMEKAEDLPAIDRILKLFGMIPLDASLRSYLEPLYQEQVAGVYDPRERVLFIRDHLKVESAIEPILAHELDHALVDQNFDLKKFIYTEDVLKNSEKQVARQAVAEGDATLVMMVFQMNQLGMETTVDDIVQVDPGMLEGMLGMASALGQAYGNMPAWLLRMFVAPYIDGYRMVVSAYRRGGWKAVNTLYQNPPQTTEHLLHPERFFENEPIRYPQSFEGDPEGTVIYEDIFGELSWRLFLQHWLDEETAKDAADGWDGDRCRLVRLSDDRYRFDAVVIMDNEDEAQIFSSALKRALTQVQQKNPALALDYTVKQEADRVSMQVFGTLKESQETEANSLPFSGISPRIFMIYK